MESYCAREQPVKKMTPKQDDDDDDCIRFRGSPEPNNNRSSRQTDGSSKGGTKPGSLSCSAETLPAIHFTRPINSRSQTRDSDSEDANTRFVILQNLHYLPLLGMMIAFLSIFTSYGLAVHQGDVPAWLPYISDAGGDPPQSSIFSMGMNLVGLMSFAVCLGIYLYYLIVEAQNSKGSRIISRLGKLLVISGFYMCIGLFGVATNPVGHLRRDGDWTWVVLVPHLVGAAVFFGSGIGMMIIITYITFLIERPNYMNKMFISRVVILLGSLLSGLLVIIRLPSMDDIEKLKPSPDHGRIYPEGMTWSTFGECARRLTTTFSSLVGAPLETLSAIRPMETVPTH
ncbi:DNA damage-regulated autophagy modulator protein 2-like isoform X2 [Varroa jacobsoni]|uniref:DNA damage-regulated autophagy modulator protein 2-like isoform X2 n=1 Tax=Varroa jacobsoni TaxID=62625 RepID=UPI000BF3EF5C|nr:DNA damage-regulated autophagy modulator protein 2-like isoform X2 [Varroa jacobsoni]